MKYRRDFVTNSSSSSFICVFENQDEFKNRMQILLATSLNKETAAVLYEDLEKYVVSRKDVMKEIREELEDSYDFHNLYGGHYSIPWEEIKAKRDSKEYKKERKAYVDKNLSDFMKNFGEDSVFCSVEYGDDDGEFYGSLEHKVMPHMPFVKKVISHH